MRIAIVNDLSLAREVLRRLVLSVPGYSVAWIAEDGEEAVRKAADDRPTRFSWTSSCRGSTESKPLG